MVILGKVIVSSVVVTVNQLFITISPENVLAHVIVLACSLSSSWSCIATNVIVVPATHDVPVPPVAGSAVLLNCLVTHVSITSLPPGVGFPVKLTRSLVLPERMKNLPAVTVGAVATFIVVSAASSLVARVVVNQVS